MIAEMQGIIKGGQIQTNYNDISKYNGRTVTIIINDIGVVDNEASDPFLDALEDDSLVMPTELGNHADEYVTGLRANERV